MKEIDLKKENINPFKEIAEDWALLAAGREGSVNAMTVSWGALGHLWGEDVCFVFVRPQRYTKEFMDRETLFTLSFFEQSEKEALKILGTLSGRDCDKLVKSDLIPSFIDIGGFSAPIFKTAVKTLVCKKLYAQPLSLEFSLSPEASKWYDGDWHTVYVGKIERAFANE